AHPADNVQAPPPLADRAAAQVVLRIPPRVVGFPSRLIHYGRLRLRYLDDHVINRACRGHLAGMTNRYLLFIPVAVLGCGGAGMQPDELDELDELESVQADTAAPVITSVMTDDGFRQIRQDGLSH